MKKNKDILTIITLVFIISSLGIWWWQNKNNSTIEKEENSKATELNNTKTEIIEYKQKDVPKNSKNGSCWTVSIASSSKMAWRCSTDHTIYDPCFETDSGQVVCGIDFGEEDAFELKLTEPLPKQRNDETRSPSYWKIELENGIECFVYTGTAGLLNNELVYHYCTDNAYLLSGIVDGEGGDDKTLNKDSEYWKARVVFCPESDECYRKTLPVKEVNVIKVWE